MLQLREAIGELLLRRHLPGLALAALAVPAASPLRGARGILGRRGVLLARLGGAPHCVLHGPVLVLLDLIPCGLLDLRQALHFELLDPNDVALLVECVRLVLHLLVPQRDLLSLLLLGLFGLAGPLLLLPSPRLLRRLRLPQRLLLLVENRLLDDGEGPRLGLFGLPGPRAGALARVGILGAEALLGAVQARRAPRRARGARAGRPAGVRRQPAHGQVHAGPAVDRPWLGLILQAPQIVRLRFARVVRDVAHLDVGHDRVDRRIGGEAEGLPLEVLLPQHRAAVDEQLLDGVGRGVLGAPHRPAIVRPAPRPVGHRRPQDAAARRRRPAA
mmetsp:Transcript_84004/g.256623  ORF Transcript_84004/g.256623 Transcript_84004/m.256623 type:complete len:330 (+) Transcript_84004:214-1203(+)